METVDEGGSMLVSKEICGVADWVFFFVKRVNCVFRELNWTRLVEPQPKICRSLRSREASIVAREESVWLGVGYFLKGYPA